jgi:hypothetical protein
LQEAPTSGPFRLPVEARGLGLKHAFAWPEGDAGDPFLRQHATDGCWSADLPEQHVVAGVVAVRHRPLQQRTDRGAISILADQSAYGLMKDSEVGVTNCHCVGERKRAAIHGVHHRDCYP